MMGKRFVTIWFRHLKTDWFCRHRPELKNIPFALSWPDHGRLMITEVSLPAQQKGIESGMTVADARAILPTLEILDDKPDLPKLLLKGLALWCIRYTDQVAIDLPDGLKLNVTGCAHLWGGELKYIREINVRLENLGYDVRATMADTLGASWAIAHYGDHVPVLRPDEHKTALLYLPTAALNLHPLLIEQLYKLGLRKIKNLVAMPLNALRRRFGTELIHKINQAFGKEEEILDGIIPTEPYRERLPTLEPIITRTGIEIALKIILEMLCVRLKEENLGIRKAIFSCFRMDGKIEKIDIGTHQGSNNADHIFKLFELKISMIEPAGGIEVFMMEAIKVETLIARQETLWETVSGFKDLRISEFMDRLSNRFGKDQIRRFESDEHYWPERSYKPIQTFDAVISKPWILNRPRPLHLLKNPAPIEVTAPVPDYPPMMFRYHGKIHKIKKADGPERIEREWWMDEGSHRDYYMVEDEEGKRYWLFRSGHYGENQMAWFIHGFFA